MARTKDSLQRSRARVLIVDDHPAVREALSFRISQAPDLEVCGQAADVGDALKLVGETSRTSPSSTSRLRPATASI